MLSVGAVAYSLGSENVFIGRSEEMNIVIDINGCVSRKSAAIRFEDGCHFIEDLSGKTGIYVNGKRETSKKLKSGDNIYIMGTISYIIPNLLSFPKTAYAI
jgi:S-DNA-T family DNA segregation ATPase FtsK/SpoIIIE